MAGLVTKETDRSVERFIIQIGQDNRIQEGFELLEIFKSASSLTPKVWGNEKVPDFLIGFGNYNYQRKGSKTIYHWFKVGFTVRKTKITLYFNDKLKKQNHLLDQLGKIKIGAGCIYLRKLQDIDKEILKKLIFSCLED